MSNTDPVPDYLLDEMFDDLKGLSRQIEYFVTRWAEYGSALGERLTPAQQERFEQEYMKFFEMMDRLTL